MLRIKEKKRFSPETTVFHHSSKILPLLLEDIIRCYLQGQSVCKYCYYKRKRETPITYKYCQICCKYCESVWVMPSSHLCENFGRFSYIPVPVMPRISSASKPFAYCQKSDHFLCFEKSANSEIWFAHTIEELVIWTIEREYKCSFKEYIDRYYNQDNSIPPPVANREGRNFYVRNETKSDIQEYSQTENKFDPRTIIFNSIADIPLHLLKDIANLYIQGTDVCKYCFYSRLIEVKKPLDSRGYSPACLRCKRQWQSIKVIPSSSLCYNFGDLRKVPIGIPSIKSNKEMTHQYCMKPDHFKCFKSFEDGFIFAHSVEELVVWTVESEVGYGKFMDYIKSHRTIEKRSVSSNQDFLKNHAQYDPDSCPLFNSISDIPSSLHSNIAQNFEKHLHVCRICFFDSLDGIKYNANPTLSSKDENSRMCERGHIWRSIRIMPSSEMCKSYSKYVAIPPVPKHMQHNKSPFKVCTMGDHSVCFDKTRDNNPWFPHTIEEMVIWTVERERSADYVLVYRDYITNSTFSDESVISSKGSQENMSESEVDTALATLVEGVERLLNSQTNRSASNEYSVSTVSENRGGGASGGLSLDEATKFFPALVTNTASNEVYTHNEGYSCFLCYRQFDTPREIALHCLKAQHMNILERDMSSTSLWKYYPPPPDKSPNEFDLCQKHCNRPVSCCKAHSIEELTEWHSRYNHRSKDMPKTTPSQLISFVNRSVNMSSYRGIELNMESTLNTGISLGKATRITFSISGQAWQSLIGIQCNPPLSIISIKGDTIYSIFPNSSTWIASNYSEAILLGVVTVTVSVTPTSIGTLDCSMTFYIGSLECVKYDFQLMCVFD